MAASEAETTPQTGEAAPLYEDAFITLTSTCLTIRKYFFPLGTAKTIAVTDIGRIWQGTDPELGLNFFKKKTWGVALSNVWWAFCTLREANDDKNNFVIRDTCGGVFRHGFTVEHPDEALRAFHSAAPQAFN